MSDKPTIFLVGDSTVQSYGEECKPQAGWGQVFYECFKESDEVRSYVRPDAPGKHVVTYEMPSLKIENHAFAARSSRSFIEQGRLDEIMKVARPGDFMMVQFAHNDAYEAKEERYVPVDKFGEWLKKYKDACDARDMHCIFVTPVSMRVFDKESGKCLIAFKEYRDAMIEAASKMNAPCVDLSLMSTEMNTELGPEKTRDIYLWVYPGEYPDSTFSNGNHDNAHFQINGAGKIAGLVAEGLKSLSGYAWLDPLRSMIKDKITYVSFERQLPQGFVWYDESDMQGAAKAEILKRN